MSANASARSAIGLLCAAMLLCALPLGGVACSRGADDKSKNESTPSEAAHQAEPAGPRDGNGNVVSVNDEMLRDLRITTSKVEQRRGGDTVNLLGELGVNENVYAEVGPPLQARVTAIRASVGDTIRRGDPLATLESGELAKARGDLAIAEARVTLAQRTLERKQGLFAERIAPAREVQEAEHENAAAEAQRRAAIAALQALGAATDEATTTANATRLTLRTPVTGVVLERTAVLGQVADPLKPLFRIGDLTTLWLTVRAFERDAVRLRIGAPARIAFAAFPGRTFDGAIALIGRSVDPQSRTVPVRIDLPNREGMLRPGMSAAARLPVGEAGEMLLAVPTAALQRVRDRWCVFVPKDARTFEIRPVGRGRDLGGEVEIVSGLHAADTIVVDGAFLLKAETERGASEGEHEEHR
jgi:membrane fusion protein, heavy metal efflux system